MFRGGYKIIDFRDTPFTIGGAAMMIGGIHDAIEASYRKPLMLSGLVVGGTEYGDVYAIPAVSDSAYVFDIAQYDIKITVQSTDAVTIAKLTKG